MRDPLLHTQTDRHTDIMLLLYKDFIIIFKVLRISSIVSTLTNFQKSLQQKKKINEEKEKNLPNEDEICKEQIDYIQTKRKTM